ncbi:MAG: hypothetical protein J5802_00700 [Butyrivibrio sp.]|nr:hypothetical protein [Butyrivibrio sp.]
MQRGMIITAVVGMIAVDAIMMTLFYLLGMINSPATLLRGAIVCALYSAVILMLFVCTEFFSRLSHRRWQRR